MDPKYTPPSTLLFDPAGAPRLRPDGKPVRASASGKTVKGVPFGRCAPAIIKDGRELTYHYTKGWRSRRA